MEYYIKRIDVAQWTRERKRKRCPDSPFVRVKASKKKKVVGKRYYFSSIEKTCKSALSIFASTRGEINRNSSVKFPYNEHPLSVFVLPNFRTHEYHRNPRNIAKFSNLPPLLSAIPPLSTLPFERLLDRCLRVRIFKGHVTWMRYVEAARCPCARIRTRDGGVDRGRKRCIHPSIHPSPIVSPPTPRGLLPRYVEPSLNPSKLLDGVLVSKSARFN